MKLERVLNKVTKQKTAKPTKRRVTLYIDAKIYEEFQKKCGETPVSNVIESIMRDAEL